MPKRRRQSPQSTNGAKRSKQPAATISLQSQIAVETGDAGGKSAVSSISLLNYNQSLARQSAIDSYGWQEVLPTTRLPDKDPNVPLEFRFDAIENSYTDFFGGFLDYSISIWHTDDQACDAAEQVCPINLCGLTYFNRVELWTNDIQLLGFHNDYSYICYNHALLYATPYAKDYPMKSWGWFPDKATLFDQVPKGTDKDPDFFNQGARLRKGLLEGSRSQNFIVPVQFDLGGVVNLIPDKAELQLRYFRNKPEFFLMKDGLNTETYYVKLERAVFRMVRYQLAAGELSHLNRVLHGSGFSLAATQVVIKKRTFMVGEQNLSFTAFREILPSFILVWFVSQNAVNGSYTDNPFEYSLLALRKVGVYKNDIPYPLSNGLQIPKVANMELNYFFLMRNLHGGSPTFLPDDMVGGYSIYCFDMTTGNTSNSAITSRTETGTIRVEVDLHTPLGKQMVMFVQGVFPKNVKFTGQREMSIVDVK